MMPRETGLDSEKRTGICSAKGNPNFNCLLMLTLPEVIDSVIVHELCHRKEMNHSKAFYAEVRRVFPDYWKWDSHSASAGSAASRVTGSASACTCTAAMAASTCSSSAGVSRPSRPV